MLEPQTIEIPLGGLEQKQSSLTRVPGSLHRAINVVFDKTGMLNKRRGYRYVDIEEAVRPVDLGLESRFTSCSTFRDELVLFGRSVVIAVVSPTGGIRTDDTVVYRGPCQRGALRVEYYTSGSPSERDGEG